MTLSIVVAMDRLGTIGRAGGLPWHLPEDLKRFRAITWGKPIVMGRRTHESIGRALPGRQNIVVTRNAGYRAEGCVVVSSLEAAYAHAAPAGELMVVGGADIYHLALPDTGRLYVTRVHAEIAGDVRFPEVEPAQWIEVAREDREADDRHAWPYSFLVYERQRR